MQINDIEGLAELGVYDKENNVINYEELSRYIEVITSFLIVENGIFQGKARLMYPCGSRLCANTTDYSLRNTYTN